MASDDELGPFNAEEAADIIRKMGLGEDDDLILVGGQAVAFWTRRLAENDPRLEEYLLTSKDVDFLGRLSDAREIADRLGGTVRYPSADHVNTPEIAVISGKWNDKNLRIDLLGYLAGLSTHEVRNSAIPITDARTGMTIRVMHPLHVLESRYVNVSPPFNRKDPVAFAQLDAAIDVVVAFIELTARQKDKDRAARKMIRRVLDIATEDKALSLRKERGVDPWARLTAADLSGLPPDFHAKQLPRMKAEHEKRCAKYEKAVQDRRERLVNVRNRKRILS